jgi:hypothetical protein
MASDTTAGPHDSAYDLFDRWLAHRRAQDRRAAEEAATVAPVAPEPVPAPPAPAAVAFVRPRPAPVATPAPVAAPAPVVNPRPEPARAAEEVVDLSRGAGRRRFATLTVAATAVATTCAAYLALRTPGPLALGTAAVLAAVTVLAASRSGTPAPTVTVRGGELEILRDGSRYRFALLDHHTPVDVLGSPGDRDWRVLFHRRGLAPFVVDASMVDPVAFTDLLRQYRPELP